MCPFLPSIDHHVICCIMSDAEVSLEAECPQTGSFEMGTALIRATEGATKLFKWAQVSTQNEPEYKLNDERRRKYNRRSRKHIRNSIQYKFRKFQEPDPDEQYINEVSDIIAHQTGD